MPDSIDNTFYHQYVPGERMVNFLEQGGNVPDRIPGKDRYPMQEDIEAIPLGDLAKNLSFKG